MLKITIKNLQKKVSIYPSKIKETIKNVLKVEKVKNKGEITICFIRDGLMRKFNKKYLKERSSTDVLAFDISDRKRGKGLCADILISTDTALRNAKKFKTTPSYELRLYAAHGLLHILGYDDHSSTKQKVMREKESQYVHT